MHWLWLAEWLVHHCHGHGHLHWTQFHPGGVSTNPPPVSGPVPVPHQFPAA